MLVVSMRIRVVPQMPVCVLPHWQLLPRTDVVLRGAAWWAGCAVVVWPAGTPLAPIPGRVTPNPWDEQVNCYAACDGSSASKTNGVCPPGK